MRSFTWTILAVHVLALLISTVQLINDNYPRHKSTGRGGDFASALISLGFVVWAAVLLAYEAQEPSP